MLLKSTRLFFIITPILVEAYNQKRMLTAPFLSDLMKVNKRALTPSLHRLMQVGFLRSQTGGTNPGFIFAKDPRQISITEVVMTLEGVRPMDPCRELFPEANHTIKDGCTCLLCTLMNKQIAQAVDVFTKISLYDLYEDADKEYIKGLLQ